MAVELIYLENNLEYFVSKVNCPSSIYLDRGSQKLNCSVPAVRDLTKAYRIRVSFTEPITMTALVSSRPITYTLNNSQIITAVSGDINGLGTFEFPYTSLS